jgi:RNA polymerase sigma-70 factor (ECF subfamily)
MSAGGAPGFAAWHDSDDCAARWQDSSAEGQVVASSDPALPRYSDVSAPGACARGVVAAPAADPDDRQLVARLLEGDGRAWRSFVERFGRLVLARGLAAARELGRPLDAAAADDLCAEVFSRLVADNFRVLRQYEGRSRLSTWLCVVTRRIALRQLSSLRREPALPSPGGERALVGLATSRDDEPLRRLLAGEERSRLAAALAQLDHRHRQLLGMLYLEGCSYREAASRLQMPMNSIGPTLARLYQKLRASLADGEPD